MSNRNTDRAKRTAPHATLKGVRKASGMKLEQVAEAVNAVLGPKSKVNRGTISAIESGIRGASVQMLDAMAVAYGMEPGDLVTDYEPRLGRELGETA